MNKKIAIVGSDSFIAIRFFSKSPQYEKCLFTANSSEKKGEVVKDLFSIGVDDFKGMDVVINFAAKVHQSGSTNELEYNRVNTELPIYLAKVAKEAGIKHFVQMSTLGVYGDVSTCSVDSPYKPVSFYGQSKMNADLGLLDIADDTFKLTIMRSPIVYGGGLSPGNMQRLVRFALQGIPLPIKGLNNQRDVIHVYNLIEALQLVIDDVLDGIYIPTDKHSISSENIYDAVAAATTKKVRKFSMSLVLKIIEKIFPVIYQKVFGDCKVECNLPDAYQPKHKFEDGIRDIVYAIEKT